MTNSLYWSRASTNYRGELHVLLLVEGNALLLILTHFPIAFF